MTRRLSLLLFFLILFLSEGYSQNIIGGVINDSTGKPIHNVNIVYKEITSNEIKGYAISDNQGNYKIHIDSKEDSIVLVFSSIGYSQKSEVLQNKSGIYNLTLEESSRRLEDVVVKSTPVYQVNDTINYNVSAFADKMDRSIGDVIKKLPGIEMVGNKILFNGKPLLKYNINGLDMLGGQYSLANDNLPVDAVKKVQIIQNDQPIKVLDSLVFSNNASLNIQLKKFTTTGSATLGMGGSPLLWNTNITPMTFSKSFQMLNTFQANNVGDDVTAQLNNNTMNEMYSFLDDTVSNSNMTFTGVTNPPHPPFDGQLWLNNNIKLLNSNFLKRLNSGVQLTGNLSYYNDFQKNEIQSNTTVYTPGQNITVGEIMNGTFNTNYLQGRFSILKNEKNIYLTDKLDISKKWDNNTSSDLRNDTSNIFQHGYIQPLSINNLFVTGLFIGKQLVSISSKVSYNQSEQQLSVTPGQFSSILNDSIAYNNVIQNVAYKKLILDNNIGFTKGINKFSISTKAGIAFQSQWLSSLLQTESDSVLSSTKTESMNNLQLLNNKFYVLPSFQFKDSHWKFQFDAPLRLNVFSLKDKLMPLNRLNSPTTFTVDPKVFLNYYLSDTWKVALSSNYSNYFGDISQLYSSYILSSFSNLQRMSTNDIGKQNVWNNNLSIIYQDPIKAVFANASLGYSMTRSNLLFDNVVDSVGATYVKTIEQYNNKRSYNFSANFSKFIGALKTIFKVNGSALHFSSPVMLYNLLSTQNTTSYLGSLEIDNNSLKFIDFQFHSQFAFIYSSIDDKGLNNIKQQTQRLDINLFPFKNQSLSFNSEYYSNNSKSNGDQFFLNLKYTYSIPNKKIDLIINCNNLLNNKLYTSIENSSYSIVRTQYQLRPRQFLASIKFNFK